MRHQVEQGSIPVYTKRVDGLDIKLTTVRSASDELDCISLALGNARKGSLPDLAHAYVRGSNLFSAKEQALPREFSVISEAFSEQGVLPNELIGFISDGNSDERIERVLGKFGNPRNPDGRLGAFAEPDRRLVHGHVVFDEKKPLVVAWKDEVDAQILDLRAKELKILELSLTERGILLPFANLIDRFYADGRGGSETQIIPDSLDVKAIGPVEKVFYERAVLEQNPARLGLDSHDPKQKHALEKVHITYEDESGRAKRELYGFIHDWLSEHPEMSISSKQIQTIGDVLETIYEGTTQISESSLRWSALYALESVLGNRESIPEQRFHWTLAMGGDQVPPPYVESYVVEPLSKLSKLASIMQNGKLSFIPKLSVIATYHSQVRENRKDKAGNDINPFLHLYNSRATVERLHAFVEEFYPETAEHVQFVELPDYHQNGSARLLYAHLWRRIAENGALSPSELSSMFHIKGDVQEDGHDTWGEDPVVEHFREEGKPEVNPYVPRHVISNMIYSNVHSLRWGAWRTEPQFHVVPMHAVSDMRKNSHEILHEFAQDTEHFPYTNGLRAIDEVRRQLEAAPDPRYIKAQNGIHVHASYYKHREEPSLSEIVQDGGYSADSLRLKGRADKAQELENAFGTVESAIGKKRYLDFLSHIVDSHVYAPYSADGISLRSALEFQEERMEEYLIKDQEARGLLNFHLS